MVKRRKMRAAREMLSVIMKVRNKAYKYERNNRDKGEERDRD